MSGNRLGIDFGTSFSTMAVLDKDGRRTVTLRDEAGNEKIPSLVYWDAGKVKVGQSALYLLQDIMNMNEQQRFHSLGRIIKSIKSNFFGDTYIALPDGSVVSALDVVIKILSYLKHCAEELYFHETVNSVNLTFPVAFTEEQKSLLESAAVYAGFKYVNLIPVIICQIGK